ncbi:unnamed protein product [Polarella glacialis]|uniref:Uncharacterized protein n=1 Tax=Polarella glacialis TaxID=89957 RepID=A0A813GMV3_POLGL|nr:unnamed protein product [Polarella glacialis]CAE8686312.1 unnamed protein product [Polarella glacialis]
MVLGLLGSYESDGEEDDAPVIIGTTAPVKEAAKPKEAPAAARIEAEPEPHDNFCNCADCKILLARYMAKNLQTKGIRFRCKLSEELFNSKLAAEEHYMDKYEVQLQEFKRQKNPRLFQKGPTPAELTALRKKISFTKEDVLKKRPADEDSSFGGWAKKLAPEPPPCMAADFQDQQEDVFTAPPWQGTKPEDENTTEMDRELDRTVTAAQATRFCKRNVLAVNATTVRCKLCYKTLGGVKEAEVHIRDEHEDDFQKEVKIWERFLFTICKRQPPFGWVCKLCGIFFPDDGACWRHAGKEVFIRGEEKHLSTWIEKEDRWGHEADQECCGDGHSSTGLSHESSMAIKEQLIRADAQAKNLEALRNKDLKKEDAESSSSDSDDEKKKPVIKSITEF